MFFQVVAVEFPLLFGQFADGTLVATFMRIWDSISSEVFVYCILDKEKVLIDRSF